MDEYEWGFKIGKSGDVNREWSEHWSADYARGINDGLASRVTA